MEVSSKLQPSDSEASEAYKQLYQSITGSLMYGMTGTRPELNYTVSTLSKFNSNLGLRHMGAGKQLLCYLKGIMTHGIEYGGPRDLDLIAFTNLDYVGDIETRRSITGYIFILNGGAIS